jgi:hypothetical protein
MAQHQVHRFKTQHTDIRHVNYRNAYFTISEPIRKYLQYKLFTHDCIFRWLKIRFTASKPSTLMHTDIRHVNYRKAYFTIFEPIRKYLQYKLFTHDCIFRWLKIRFTASKPSTLMHTDIRHVNYRNAHSTIHVLKQCKQTLQTIKPGYKC